MTFTFQTFYTWEIGILNGIWFLFKTTAACNRRRVKGGKWNEMHVRWRAASQQGFGASRHVRSRRWTCFTCMEAEWGLWVICDVMGNGWMGCGWMLWAAGGGRKWVNGRIISRQKNVAWKGMFSRDQPCEAVVGKSDECSWRRGEFDFMTGKVNYGVFCQGIWGVLWKGRSLGWGLAGRTRMVIWVDGWWDAALFGAVRCGLGWVFLQFGVGLRCAWWEIVDDWVLLSVEWVIFTIVCGEWLVVWVLTMLLDWWSRLVCDWWSGEMGLCSWRIWGVCWGIVRLLVAHLWLKANQSLLAMMLLCYYDLNEKIASWDESRGVVPLSSGIWCRVVSESNRRCVMTVWYWHYDCLEMFYNWQWMSDLSIKGLEWVQSDFESCCSRVLSKYCLCEPWNQWSTRSIQYILWKLANGKVTIRGLVSLSWVHKIIGS